MSGCNVTIDPPDGRGILLILFSIISFSKNKLLHYGISKSNLANTSHFTTDLANQESKLVKKARWSAKGARNIRL